MSTPSNERIFESLDDFLAAVAEAGVRRIVLRHVHEHRPVPGTNYVPRERYRRIDLLAYRDAVLYKCVVEGAAPADVTGSLAAAGIGVKVVSGNIT